MSRFALSSIVMIIEWLRHSEWGATVSRVLNVIAQINEVIAERDSMKAYLLKAEDRVAVLQGMVCQC